MQIAVGSPLGAAKYISLL